MKLVIADEGQKRARDRLTFASWGARLTPEQYCLREQRLRQHPWARGALTTWLLCDGGEVVSSCETFRMTSSSRSRPASTHGVASMFTEPALRGRGHASALMKLLMRELPERSPDLHASILFSDVGAALYEQVGFRAVPAHDWIFPTEAGSPSAVADQLLTEDSVRDICPEPTRPFLVWPAPEQVDWHLERERTYAAVLSRARPESCGARVGRSAIVWAAKYETDELMVLLLAADRPGEAEALLRAARRAAHGASLVRVRWWECPLPFELPAAFAGGRRVPRDGELPMLLLFHPDVRAQDWTCIPRAIWV